jgi:formylglycine-generating enzyme required for sulfatase activity
MKRLTYLLCLVFLLLSAADAWAVTINTVPVGNPGNDPDQLYTNNNPNNLLFGSVAYDYRIGSTEVTVGQYTDFLNAVAATDTYALYSPSMGTDLNISGISRSGASGSYSYGVIGSANNPVTYVSWGDAARFSNWLHNGQPTGLQDASTTEGGSYTLNGAITNFDLLAITRNGAATWVIPSENEWYKAAYHKNDGATGNYWVYPTSTDSEPNSDQPPGDLSIQSNVANFYKNDGIANDYNDGFAVNGSINSPTGNALTDVGAYSFSLSPYGTFDQGGNVYEWNEALISSFRGLRGGSWGFDVSSHLAASSRDIYASFPPSGEGTNVGFRVAKVVPEPSTVVLAAMGILGLIACARRRRFCLRS